MQSRNVFLPPRLTLRNNALTCCLLPGKTDISPNWIALNIHHMHQDSDKMMDERETLTLCDRFQWMTKHAWSSKCQKRTVCRECRHSEGSRTRWARGPLTWFLGCALGSFLCLSVVLLLKSVEKENVEHSDQWTRGGMHIPFCMWHRQTLIRKTTGRW